MASADQIREIVARYLSDGDADKFVLDFAAASYNIHENGSPEAIALVNKLEAKIADLHGGCISISDFKNSLRVLMPFIVRAYVDSPPITTSANSIMPSSLNWTVDWRESSILFGDRQLSSV